MAGASPRLCARTLRRSCGRCVDRRAASPRLPRRLQRTRPSGDQGSDRLPGRERGSPLGRLAQGLAYLPACARQPAGTVRRPTPHGPTFQRRDSARLRPRVTGRPLEPLSRRPSPRFIRHNDTTRIGAGIGAIFYPTQHPLVSDEKEPSNPHEFNDVLAVSDKSQGDEEEDTSEADYWAERLQAHESGERAADS
jgi:hypothetical protein